MQDRYVADIGDYVKFAILRALAPGRRLGVAWWLFPDEHHNADGGHREYLERKDRWGQYDPELFEALSNIDMQRKLDVGAIEKAGILPNAVFAAEPVPCDIRPFQQRPEKRRDWLAKIKAKFEDCNLIFLDPDNGIAPARLRLTQRRAGKSVTIDEIKGLLEGNRAMVIYHHQTRRKGGHKSEIRDLAEQLSKAGLQVSGALRTKPWSPRVFFILNGDKELCDRAKGLAECWRVGGEDRISWRTGAEILRGLG